MIYWHTGRHWEEERSKVGKGWKGQGGSGGEEEWSRRKRRRKRREWGRDVSGMRVAVSSICENEWGGINKKTKATVKL